METPDLLELIQAYDAYIQESGNRDLAAFGVWLNRRQGEQIKERATHTFSRDENRTIVWLINRLGKYFRWYSKRVLNENGLNSLDEYFFLISIHQLGTPSKTEVYRDTITELNTGTQMMKRLIEIGMVKEVPDKKDKRIKRVELTARGKKAREAILRQSVPDVRLKAGNLSPDEKKQLIAYLSYMEKFHHQIYFNDPDLSFEEMIDKYLLT